jgi:hypothetical protein
MSAIAIRRSPSSFALGAGVAAIVVVMAILVTAIFRTMRHVKPVRATAPPISGVVWGDGIVFSQPPAMAHWLRVHGVAYSVWAERHPPASKLLKRHVLAQKKTKG